MWSAYAPAPGRGIRDAITAEARGTVRVCERGELKPVFWGKPANLGEKLWRTGSRLPAFVRRPPRLHGRNRTGPGGLGRNPVPHEGTAPGETLWKTFPSGSLFERRRTTTRGTGTPKTHGEMVEERDAMSKQVVEMSGRSLACGARDPLRRAKRSKAPGRSQWAKCPWRPVPRTPARTLGPPSAGLVEWPGSSGLRCPVSARVDAPTEEVRAIKRTYQPKKRYRKRVHGFLVKMRSPGGRRILRDRRRKGRHKLTP